MLPQAFQRHYAFKMRILNDKAVLTLSIGAIYNNIRLC